MAVVGVTAEATEVMSSDSLIEESSSSPQASITTPSLGTTKQRNYVLNDVGALKKKLSHEKRADDISINKEAKNHSNVIIHMKASFFEYVKANFVHELEQNPSITTIKNAEGVKAATESCGDAFVEYSVEITFTSGDHSHTVKITAYTMTS